MSKIKQSGVGVGTPFFAVVLAVQLLFVASAFGANAAVSAERALAAAPYRITFDVNEGTVINPSFYDTKDDGTLASLPPTSPTRTNYTFEGWYTAKTSGTKVTTSTVFDKNTTVYAQWTINVYTISFDATTNGGTVTTMTGKTGETPSTAWKLASLPTPTKNTANDAYTFDGWYTTQTTGGEKVTVNSTVFNGNVTIYARWTPKSYTISYTLDGGTVDPPNPTSYNIETATFKLNNPTKVTYEFAGWTGTGITTTEPEKNVTIEKSTGNRSYTAKWTPIFYTITFDPKDGGTITETQEKAKTVAGGKLTSLPTPTTKTGYTFDGWYTTDGTDGVKVAANSTVFTDDAYIYARYKLVTYKITYNLSGGTVSPTNPNPDEYTIETPGFSLNPPTRIAYTFTGWTGANGTTPAEDVSIEQGSTGAKSYTANWSANLYTIKLEANGGTVTPDTARTVAGGKLASSLPTPVLEGNIFEGWFTDETYAIKVTTSTVFGDDATIYALWTPIYIITFDANGGTVSPATGKTGSGYKLASLPTPTKTGNAFDGWFTDEEEGDKVTVSTVFDRECTIYAHWLTAYAVTFSAGVNGTLTATVGGAPITTGAGVGEGKNVVFTAAPASGYEVGKWTVNGTVVDSVKTAYTLTNVSAASTVLVSFVKSITQPYVASPDRVIPVAGSDDGAAAVAPVSRLTAAFAAGPNPVGRSSGSINFFSNGSRIVSATLSIYDASGNTVKKISISGNAVNGRRPVASWDLTDNKGRLVSEGTYLVKGVVKTSNGKSEKVSLVVGVR